MDTFWSIWDFLAPGEWQSVQGDGQPLLLNLQHPQDGPTILLLLQQLQMRCHSAAHGESSPGPTTSNRTTWSGPQLLSVRVQVKEPSRGGLLGLLDQPSLPILAKPSIRGEPDRAGQPRRWWGGLLFFKPGHLEPHWVRQRLPSRCSSSHAFRWVALNLRICQQWSKQILFSSTLAFVPSHIHYFSLVQGLIQGFL